jgi:hypothetical protein
MQETKATKLTKMDSFTRNSSLRRSTLSDVIVLIVIAQRVPQAALALVDVLTKVRIGRDDRRGTLDHRLLTQL